MINTNAVLIDWAQKIIDIAQRLIYDWYKRHIDPKVSLIYTNSLLIMIYMYIVAQKLQKGSEWLLFSANSAIFQLYHGENKLIFNDMIMRSALY